VRKQSSTNTFRTDYTKMTQSTPSVGLLSKWHNLSPAIKFLVGFVVSIILFYLLFYSAPYEKWIGDPFIKFQGWVSAGILDVFGLDASSTGQTLSGDGYSVNIQKNCDGSEVTALFLCSILVFPIAFRYKLPGLLLGGLILITLNILRICLLFMSGKNFPEWFDFLHEQGGPVVFIAISVLLWIVWANWALKRTKLNFVKTDETPA